MHLAATSESAAVLECALPKSSLAKLCPREYHLCCRPFLETYANFGTNYNFESQHRKGALSSKADRGKGIQDTGECTCIRSRRSHFLAFQIVVRPGLCTGNAPRCWGASMCAAHVHARYIWWQDKITNLEISDRAEATSMEATILKAQLRWTEYAIRMKDSRIPPHLLNSEFSLGKRNKGWSHTQIKDCVKANIAQAGIPKVFGRVCTRPHRLACTDKACQYHHHHHHLRVVLSLLSFMEEPLPG